MNEDNLRATARQVIGLKGEEVSDESNLKITKTDVHEITEDEMTILHQMIATWRFGKWAFFLIAGLGSMASAVYGAAVFLFNHK